MCAMKDPAQPEDLEKLLAERFRSERKRLNMSAVSVAHYCNVATSTVFNWEAGKARIPLAALAVLWRHGFDLEGLVKTQMREIPLPIHPRDQGKTFSVPEHLLHRHQVYPETGFVLHCQSQIGDVIPAGQLCLMQWCPTDADVLSEIDGLVMLQDKQGGSEALCHMRSTSKGRVQISLEKLSFSTGAKAFLAKCEIVGEYCCQLGFRPLKQPDQSRNMRRLVKLIESIKEARLGPTSKKVH